MENSNDHLNGKLKHLLSICNDGKEGYRNASEDVDSTELKSIFNTYSIQRSEYAMELKTLLRNQGSDPDNSEGGPLGALHRTWMDIKSAITGKGNEAILSACVTGEKSALEAYDDVLNDTNVTPEVRTVLTNHRQGIQEALQTIESLERQHS